MSANLLTETNWIIPTLALAAASLPSIARSLVSLLKKMVEEKSRTERFNKALEGSKPQQRAEIILACGQLEGGTTGEQATKEPDETTASSAAEKSLVTRILRSGRPTEPGKE